MVESVQKDLAVILQAIKNFSTPRKVFLFGSMATGTSNPASDIDLCIVAETSKSRTETLRSIRKELFARVEHPLDLLLYSPEEFENCAEVVNSFEWNISHRGIPIHG